MIHDWTVKLRGFPHGKFHDGIVRHGTPVVREGDRPGPVERLEVGNVMSRPLPGDAGSGEYMDEIRGFGPPGEIPHRLRSVEGGVGIGHGYDGRESAPGSRPTSGLDRFRRLMPRFTKMNVKIHKTRCGDKPCRLNDGGVCWNDLRNTEKPAIFDKKVANGVDSGGRVNDPGALDKKDIIHGMGVYTTCGLTEKREMVLCRPL